MIIENRDKLVEILAHNPVFDEVVGASVRIFGVSGRAPELLLEAFQEKFIFPILAELHPSRRILDKVRDFQAPLILLAPHIPQNLAADLRRARINHADLNGRLFIQTDKFLLVLEPKQSRYRNPVADPAPFSLKSSRLIRALLSHRSRAWTQEELVQCTGVSRGLVSRIVNSLVRDRYVERKGLVPSELAKYFLNDFDGLLNAWAAEDRWQKRVAIQQYSLLSSDLFSIARKTQEALGPKNVVFTQWFAAHLRHPYTVPPLVSCYVKLKTSTPISLGRRVDSGGNLWLILPRDEGVFLETQEKEGFTLATDVQIYLDILQVGQRGPDQAEELRNWGGFANDEVRHDREVHE